MNWLRRDLESAGYLNCSSRQDFCSSLPEVRRLQQCGNPLPDYSRPLLSSPCYWHELPPYIHPQISSQLRRGYTNMITHVLYNHRAHQFGHVLTISHGSFSENTVTLQALFLWVVASLALSWTPVLVIYSPSKLNSQVPSSSAELCIWRSPGSALHFWFPGRTVLRPLEEPFLFSGKSGDIFIKFHSLPCPVSSHLFWK